MGGERGEVTPSPGESEERSKEDRLNLKEGRSLDRSKEDRLNLKEGRSPDRSKEDRLNLKEGRSPDRSREDRMQEQLVKKKPELQRPDRSNVMAPRETNWPGVRSGWESRLKSNGDRPNFREGRSPDRDSPQNQHCASTESDGRDGQTEELKERKSSFKKMGDAVRRLVRKVSKNNMET